MIKRTRLTQEKLLVGLLVLAVSTIVASNVWAKSRVNNFPTQARAEFVFACMSANGTNQEFLRNCSCAIDTIAAHMTYSDYEKAETILRLQLGHSEREQAYKSVGLSQDILERLFHAQAASELTCF